MSKNIMPTINNNVDSTINIAIDVINVSTQDCVQNATLSTTKKTISQKYFTEPGYLQLLLRELFAPIVFIVFVFLFIILSLSVITPKKLAKILPETKTVIIVSTPPPLCLSTTAMQV